MMTQNMLGRLEHNVYICKFDQANDAYSVVQYKACSIDSQRLQISKSSNRLQLTAQTGLKLLYIQKHCQWLVVFVKLLFIDSRGQIKSQLWACLKRLSRHLAQCLVNSSKGTASCANIQPVQCQNVDQLTVLIVLYCIRSKNESKTPNLIFLSFLRTGTTVLNFQSLCLI